MNKGERVKAWKNEERRPFSGWDFLYLDGRMVEEQPPWSYLTRAAELMRRSSAVLDMGTGRVTALSTATAALKETAL